jgi:hypothetical protein
MLDTFSLSEHWRALFDSPSFSSEFYKQAIRATDWLYNLVEPLSGDAPNIGANDGTRLLPLIKSGYRDFRPSVQMAMALFSKKSAYGSGAWNEGLRLLSIPVPSVFCAPLSSEHFPNGGFIVLRNRNVFLLFRYPCFNFRPSQADALHIDFWEGERNLLCDDGTYSYSVNKAQNECISGTGSHNTIQFDDRDQMPRISRFLYGEWLKVDKVKFVKGGEDELYASAGYQDYLGARHDRSIDLNQKYIRIVDSIAGFKNKAILRWRLVPGSWSIDGNTISNGENKLSISTELTIYRFEIVEGWKSLYYLQKTSLPVLEVEVHRPGVIISTYEYKL